MVKQTVNVKVGCKTYNVSNSWNSLFLCGNEGVRRATALSVFEQLRMEKYKEKVEVRLLSHAPDRYDEGLVGAFDAEVIEVYLKEMERRYDLMSVSETKHYMQYNQRNADRPMKLQVLIVEGAEVAADAPAYARFFALLQVLVQKSRAAGIHVISFVNELPREKEDLFKYYGTPVHVMRKGFFMKDATNTIMKELYALGFSPVINVSYDNEKETIWIGINLEVEGVHLAFSYYYDAQVVDYALLFPIDEPIDFDSKMEIYRILRTDGSHCYDTFSDDCYEGHLALTGSKWANRITPLFVQCMVEEISSLKVVKKLKMLQSSDFIS